MEASILAGDVPGRDRGIMRGSPPVHGVVLESPVPGRCG
jgi:hypothetical protein